MPIQKVNMHQINASLLGLSKYSNSSLAKIKMLLSSAFHKATLWGIITVNPFTIKGAIIKQKSSRQDKIVSGFTVEEQQLFIQQLEKKEYLYKNIFLILLHTGMRAGELLALKRSDIDLKNNLISISKTLTRDVDGNVKVGTTTKTFAGTRTIPIPSTIRNIFKQNNNFDFLFLMKNGKFISTSTINSHFKRICKDAGIRTSIYKLTRKNKVINLKTSDVNTHMLRHSYATRRAEARNMSKCFKKFTRS